MAKIKDKEKKLKSAREKQQRTPIRLSADFSVETLQARREYHNIFKVMKGKKSTTKNTPWGGVNMAAWEDAAFASPHN